MKVSRAVRPRFFLRIGGSKKSRRHMRLANQIPNLRLVPLCQGRPAARLIFYQKVSSITNLEGWAACSFERQRWSGLVAIHPGRGPQRPGSDRPAPLIAKAVQQSSAYARPVLVFQWTRASWRQVSSKGADWLRFLWLTCVGFIPLPAPVSRSG